MNRPNRRRRTACRTVARTLALATAMAALVATLGAGHALAAAGLLLGLGAATTWRIRHRRPRPEPTS